jgi:hypothetical protein
MWSKGAAAAEHLVGAANHDIKCHTTTSSKAVDHTVAVADHALRAEDHALDAAKPLFAARSLTNGWDNETRRVLIESCSSQQ